jgi:hypothetical protein
MIKTQVEGSGTELAVIWVANDVTFALLDQSAPWSVLTIGL